LRWSRQAPLVAVALAALVAALQPTTPLGAGGQAFDIIIRNGHLIDGTG